MFGYFDLDAAFSAAFILAMMGFVENDDSDSPPEGLRASAQILRYLCKAGNKAAEGRLKDLKQFCGHVWDPDKALGEWEWLQESDIPSAPSFTPGSGKSGDARDAENGARLDDGISDSISTQISYKNLMDAVTGLCEAADILALLGVYESRSKLRHVWTRPARRLQPGSRYRDDWNLR